MSLPKLALILFTLLFSGTARTLAQSCPNHSFYIYEDSSKNLAAQTALKYFTQGKFTKQVVNQKNVGFTRSVFWLAYYQETDCQPDSLLLLIGHQHINRIFFYFVSASTITRQWVTGDYYPFKQRPVQTTGFCFPIHKKGIYLARVDKSNESLQLSFAVQGQAETLIKEGKINSIMALFTGMICLLIIFGFYLYIMSGDSIYIFYILYMATGWLWVLANSGHGFQYLWPNQPWFASKARPVFAISPLIFSMLFLQKYIGGIRNSRTLLLVKVVNGVLLACVISILVFKQDGYDASWWYYIQYLIPLISFVFVVITLSVLITSVLKGNRLAMFYLAAIGVLFVFVILQVSFSFGKLESSDNFFSHFGVSVGFIMEAIILTAGLVYRFNQYRLDKENLLLRVNRQQLEHTRMIIEVQEAERTQVANQLHDVAASLLSAAKLNISSLRDQGEVIPAQSMYHVEKTEEAINMVSEMVRNLSHALSPVMLEKVGFKTSLEKIISIVNASGKIKIVSLVTGFEVHKASLNKYYIALYSIIYELLNNIVKHSGARNVLLQVTNYEDCFLLVSEDDGIGMEISQLEKINSLGLSGIQSKVDYFKGTIAFDVNQPSGLIVSIEIPYIDEEI